MAGTFVSVLCCRSDRLVDALVSIAQTTDRADFLHQNAVLKIAKTNTTILLCERGGVGRAGGRRKGGGRGGRGEAMEEEDKREGRRDEEKRGMKRRDAYMHEVSSVASTPSHLVLSYQDIPLFPAACRIPGSGLRAENYVIYCSPRWDTAQKGGGHVCSEMFAAKNQQ